METNYKEHTNKQLKGETDSYMSTNFSNNVNDQH